MNFEPYVPAHVAADHFGISRRLLLAMARRGVAGAYPIGCGDFRHRWVFKLSELQSAIDPKLDPRYEAERKQESHNQRYDRAKGGSR
jgi:hypothetical protein